MQFHLNGFEPGDPEIFDQSERYPASGAQGSVPEEVDVLIVGCGPAGLTLAAQLSAFPDIKTCIVEQKSGRMLLGQADLEWELRVMQALAEGQEPAGHPCHRPEPEVEGGPHDSWVDWWMDLPAARQQFRIDKIKSGGYGPRLLAAWERAGVPEGTGERQEAQR